MKTNRRLFCATLGAALATPTWACFKSETGHKSEHCLEIATNTYPWLTFARREKQEFELHSDELLGQIASTGIGGYEPIVNSRIELSGLAKVLDSYKLKMKSLYMNVLLHDEKAAEKNIESAVHVAELAVNLGTEIFVVNPTPIRWGGPENKDDRQLRIQREMLDQLAIQLKSKGIALAYHNHDAELREGGREFHHMLTATDPENVKLCFDAHWVYRGCGNSEVAVFDALAHYQDRIVELHLRQSKDEIWSESFSISGDIDYRKILEHLDAKNIHPLLVLEQAIEAKSPNELSVVDAHRLSYENLCKEITDQSYSSRRKK